MYLIYYLVFSLIVAALGSAKRIGFLLSLIISFFASPIVGLIVVMVSDKKVERSLIWYKCKWCGFRSQINHGHCPKCSLDDNGVPK